jgi:hypothetical protein
MEKKSFANTESDERGGYFKAYEAERVMLAAS